MSENEKSFAELFESSEMKVGTELKVGDRIKGRIISIGRDLIYVDTGTKTDGVAEKEDLLDEEGNVPFSEGDEIELFVVSIQQNEIRLARSLGGAGGIEQLLSAHENSIPVEGRVNETCKGGFRVRIMGRTGFCPLSQIDIRPVDEPETYVGETFPFLITRIEERGRNIVVSRRALQEREQAESLDSFRQEKSPGDTITGTVTRVVPFGAFVEIAPGLEGLVHISELSWSRTQAPEEVVTPGEKVTVKYLGMEEQDKGPVRISLSMKQVQPDPWEQTAPEFQTGTKLTGTVTRVVPFGAFVEIAPGIEGLVHISEMSYRKRVHKPEEEVSPGEKVPVMIKEIDLEKQRISLSMRDAEGDPWLLVQEKYSPGKIVQGIVEKREKFGIFIQLEPGVVGLMPSSKIDRSQGTSLESSKPGDKLQVLVAEIDSDKRRITLAPPDAAENMEWKSFAPQKEKMGTLGKQLQKALDRKNKS